MDGPRSSADAEAPEAARLTAGIRAGEAAAEEAFVRRYRPGLVFILRRQLWDADEAEDVAHEALMVVIARLRETGLEDPERLAGFLRRTALNLVRNENRKLARRRTDADDSQDRHAHHGPSPLDQLMAEHRKAVARELLAEVDNPRDEEVLRRFYVAEEERERICTDLGLSRQHFNCVLHRARQRFRELLEARLGPDDLDALKGGS